MSGLPGVSFYILLSLSNSTTHPSLRRVGHSTIPIVSINIHLPFTYFHRLPPPFSILYLFLSLSTVRPLARPTITSYLSIFSFKIVWKSYYYTILLFYLSFPNDVQSSFFINLYLFIADVPILLFFIIIIILLPFIFIFTNRTPPSSPPIFFWLGRFGCR